jgi:hypothetical protein
MNALKYSLSPLRVAPAVLLSVALLAISAPTLVPEAFACQNSGYCGG